MGKSVVLVGCGNMGYAMLKGWMAAGKLAAGDATVVEPNDELRGRAAKLGVTVAESGEALAGDADLVIFAVKPQVIRDVAPAYARFASGATFVSVLAGTGTATFEEILGRHAAVMRCMPNTPAAIGKGMMVLFSNRNVTKDAKAFATALLATSGAVTSIDNEELMDAVTAVSGSGPAYVFHFIECLTAAGENAGLPKETAKLLAMQTVYGAANLASESDEEPGRLREQVTSPNGTTAAALSVLMGGNRLLDLVSEAVDAAKKRSIELGK
ncbi:pyrroline-5-carboxylate reductase [Nitratireductor pacificus]|uniref:Pyrroline-5-carboxylate reductase n=1 Tax=Nitratireductor pacificus pht-3B TaxID=391937 RepID=K2N8X5_9HYPH|nr:pyrroline-5-carboxylate reductase [Nitratireductor pacificus]EKF20558.1 pyrroline-5-carboxylate reductase [Nitratireductor pacificus pht-3B]